MSKDQELIQSILDAREWQTFECKRASVKPAKCLETVVAFANTEGGFLVLGLEDPDKADGKDRLFGISEQSDNASELLTLAEREIDPRLPILKRFEVEIQNVKGAADSLLLIHIGKSNDVHSLKSGDTFVRQGSHNVKIGSSQIIQLKYEKGALKYEDEKSGIASLDDLDSALVEQLRKETESTGTDVWQFLKDNGLAIRSGERFELTKGGVLLFAKNPAVTLRAKCSIKISHYHGTREHFSHQPNFAIKPFSIEGPLLKQIEGAITYFREAVRSSPPKLSGAKFEPTLLIPEWVFQESITNAIIHRDYSKQDDIHVRFFDDRIEVESPGTYPGHITTTNIRSERFARNPIILRTLNRFVSSPNLDIGEGVDRMFAIMHSTNLYDPIFIPPDIRPHSVLVVLLNAQRVVLWDIVSRYLESHPHISNHQAREITEISDTLKMSRLLKQWVDQGLLEKKEVGGKRGTIYFKVGSAKMPTLFSRGTENGKGTT